MFNPFTIFSKFKATLIAIGVALVVFLGALAKARKSGADKVRGDQARDALKRVEKGTAAAQQAKVDQAAGKTPADIVRENDGAWK